MTTPTVEELGQRMKTAMESIRSGDTNGKIPDNLDMGTVGLMNVYPPPPDREPGTLNAQWGDTPIPRPLNWMGDYGTGTIEKARDTHRGVLDRVFDGMSEARRAAQSEINANFAHGSSGQYEARAALLEKEKTAAHHVYDEGSLTDRVRAVVRR
jgi:hypothetical protein